MKGDSFVLTIKHKAMSESNQEVREINIRSLTNLAIYLSGIKDGKGNLDPVGTIVLEDLWNAIQYLQGDVRFKAERDKK